MKTDDKAFFCDLFIYLFKCRVIVFEILAVKMEFYTLEPKIAYAVYLPECVRRIRDDYPAVKAEVLAQWPLIQKEYSFAARASQLKEIAEKHKRFF